MGLVRLHHQGGKTSCNIVQFNGVLLYVVDACWKNFPRVELEYD